MQLRILVVDDNENDYHLLAHVLKQYQQLQLTHATSVPSALEYLEKERVQLILLDLNIPLISGLEMLELIKEDCTYRKLPVVVITRVVDDKLVERVLDTQASGYFVKPSSLNDYKRLAETLVDYWTLSRLVI